MAGSRADTLEMLLPGGPMSLTAALVCGAGLVGVIAGLLLLEMYYAALILLAFPLIAVFIRNPRLWLYSGTMLLYVWLRSSDKAVSMLEVGLVVFYLGGLIFWFGAMLVQRRRILHNFADRLIILVFAFAFCFNGIAAYLHDTSLSMWVRELLLFTFMLYYFPFREHCSEKHHVTTLLIILAGVIFALGIQNIQRYMYAANNALYAFELLHSRVSMNETIFLGAAVFSIVFLLHTRNIVAKLVLLFLAVYNTGVLLASFSRGPWLALLIGIGLVFIWVSKRQKIAIMLYVTASSILIVVAISLLFGDLGPLIIRTLETRFASSTKATSDVSVGSRLAESEAALELISTYPLSGTGMGSRLTYPDPISRRTVHVYFVHNGYLFLALKLGVPLTLLFFLGLFLYVWRGYSAVGTLVKGTFYHSLSVAATSTLCAVLFLTIPANQFIVRDGLFFLALYIALISIADKRARQLALEQDSAVSGAPPARLAEQ